MHFIVGVFVGMLTVVVFWLSDGFCRRRQLAEKEESDAALPGTVFGEGVVLPQADEPRWRLVHCEGPREVFRLGSVWVVGDARLAGTCASYGGGLLRRSTPEGQRYAVLVHTYYYKRLLAEAGCRAQRSIEEG